jgi:cell wall assembly regulator SMI1
MRPAAKLLLLLGLLTMLCVAALIIAAPGLQKRFFYPKPGALPSVVGESADALLVRLQQTMEAKAPGLARHLQPGLSDAAIRQQEVTGVFKLPEDLRTLYRWHNGQAPESPDGLLPGLRFLPLENVVRERQLLRQQVAGLGFWRRLSFKAFAGHRLPWIQVLDDGASDGYFFDPERRDEEGAFFYSFAETRHFTWFPSFRNFLAGLIEAYDTGAVRVSPDGKALVEDPARTQVIWQRLSAATEI